MTALHSDSPVKSTVSKTAAFIVAIVSAAFSMGVYVTVQLSSVSAQAIETNRRLSSIEGFIRNEVVTQSQAERYAAAFKWENRALHIVVPEPAAYQDKPKS